MKYFRYSLLLLLTLVFSCSVEESTPPESVADDMFYATVEHPSSMETKVYADENLSILWNEDDRISVFNRSTVNLEYCFTGSTGENAGTFSKVASNSSPSGSSLSKVYAVYPYQEGTSIDNNGTISFTLPSEQVYHEDSFGIGANTMVSASEDNYLRFKNIGGYLVFKLYGEGVSVSSISLKGNNHEKIAGSSTIAWSNGLPVTTMAAKSTEEITLTCDDPVALGSTSADYVEFWLVVPPVTFTEGFTITVSTSGGGVFEKSTSKEISIGRSTIKRMAPIEVFDVIVFEDANFKTYCVENFDTSGDGEISFDEALAVTSIDVCTDNISSINEISFFKNIVHLYAKGSSGAYLIGEGSYALNGNPQEYPTEIWTSVSTGKLSQCVLKGLTSLRELDISNNSISILDISDNVSLRSLTCTFCNLKDLNISKNTSLNELNVQHNQLANIDLSANVDLWRLYCDFNPITTLDLSLNVNLSTLQCCNLMLTSLDVSKNSNLQNLSCMYNQLTSLNVSSLAKLQSLMCRGNQLTSLDVGNNLALRYLACERNKLTSLDLSFNSVLSHLGCSQNLLTSLIVSNNTDLNRLECFDNNLTSLDISNNENLTYLTCWKNSLSCLDVLNNIKLQYLECGNNSIISLDLHNNLKLVRLHCDNTLLSTLDVSNNTALEDLSCQYTLLSTLDVSNNSALSLLWCDNNPNLINIWLKTGQSIPVFYYDTDVATIMYKD